MDTCTCVGMHMHACMGSFWSYRLVVPFGRTTLWSYYPLVVRAPPPGTTDTTRRAARYRAVSGSLTTLTLTVQGVCTRFGSAVGLRAWFPARVDGWTLEPGPRRRGPRERDGAYGIRFAVARASRPRGGSERVYNGL